MALKSLEMLLDEAREYLVGSANSANVDALLECVRHVFVPVNGSGHMEFYWAVPSDTKIIGHYRADVYCRPGEDTGSFKSPGKYALLYVKERYEEEGNFKVGIIALRGEKSQGVFITAENLPPTVNPASFEAAVKDGRFIALTNISDPILQQASEAGAIAQ